jgi:NAD(P)-dependent dehydrogenase (short-subunit alcohol dehydrogenase family)
VRVAWRKSQTGAVPIWSLRLTITAVETTNRRFRGFRRICLTAYSISKAAAFSLTQSLRAFLAGQGVRVHGVLAGPVDTDMTRSLEMPKASPESVARAIFDGVEKAEEDIFPDPMSGSIADSWRSGVGKALERQFAAFTPENVTKVV